MSGRVVAVLGYSRRRDKELHRICAARLAHAQGLAADARAVVLSGMPEAELMRAAWVGSEVELICDPDARSTAQNAANVAAVAQALDADELVVVTSGWHRARAFLFLKLALRGSGIRVSVETARGPRPPLLLAREVVCLALVPFQLIRSRRTVG
jgi:uncharacterized SAM-binding protein YcdF (DUF218 family)